MKRLKKDNKGFTLVELIVVLVILAILAAILVPSLLGYIDRARSQQIVLNAKSVYTAAQAEMSSLYGENKPASDITSRATTVLETAGVGTDINASDVTSVIVYTNAAASTSKARAEYKITSVSYTESGKTVVFTGSTWEVNGTKPASATVTYTLK